MNRAESLHRDQYGTAASVVIDSPGRINLIGEHTDYCGLPVLPIAISQSIQIAASEQAEPGLVATSSLDGRVVRSDSDDGVPPAWAKYVLAVLDQIQPLAPGRGARLALDSDLPSTGGLSSSSALTVGCLIALNEVWGLGLEPGDLVTAALLSEQSAAIAGGAMDQTVIMYARPGHALRIDFDPPNRRHIRLPEEFVWVAGYSGTKAPKGESAAVSYNSFVLASRAAAVLLGDSPGADERLPQLSRVRNASAEELAKLPTIPVAEAAALTETGALGLPATRPLDLRVSAEHVLSEAARVETAERALVDGDLETMGRLMNESHLSLVRYGASTPSLDRLVAEARAAGAAGARVTGAGFGGWAIAVTNREHLNEVRAAMNAACGGPTFVASAQGGALWSLNAQ